MSAAALAEWLELLQRRHHRAIDLGLRRVGRVCDSMRLELNIPLVIVGGTNGKGSVCAMIESALNNAGFRCGAYLSPHLLKFNERVRVCGEDASDEQLLAAFDKTERARESANESLTYFEFTTLAAAQCIKDCACDCAVLEVGMGGRLDAVNIFTPSVAVVTNVGLDHCEFLGDTVEDIAREKAGIFRKDTPAIIGDENATPALADRAEQTGAQTIIAGRDYLIKEGENGAWHFHGRRRKMFNLPQPSLRGAHQLKNAAAALAALESLPEEFWPGVGAVRRTMRAVNLPGRAQVLPGLPVTIADVAHNADSARALERVLFEMGYFPRTMAVFGLQARKNAAAVVAALRRRVDKWFVCRPQGGDGDAAALAEAVRAGGGEAVVCGGAADAHKKARAECAENDRIVVTGSFLVVAEFLDSIMRSE